MPGYDGTGPAGRGPLTGQGRGFCVMKVPEAPDEPLTGFAGRSGAPVRFDPAGAAPSGASSADRMRRIASDIRRLRRRIEALRAETGPSDDRRS
jgi:hypothetical protein